MPRFQTAPVKHAAVVAPVFRASGRCVGALGTSDNVLYRIQRFQSMPGQGFGRGQRHAFFGTIDVAVASPPLLGLAFRFLTRLGINRDDRLFVQTRHSIISVAAAFRAAGSDRVLGCGQSPIAIFALPRSAAAGSQPRSTGGSPWPATARCAECEPGLGMSPHASHVRQVRSDLPQSDAASRAVRRNRSARREECA